METGPRHDMAWRAAHASAWRAYRGWRGENWDEREAVAAAAAAAIATYRDLMAVLPPEQGQPAQVSR